MKYGSRAPNPEALAIVLSGNTQGTPLSVSGAAAQTAALDGGLYDIWSDVDVYLKVATIANDVTTATGYLLRANNTVALLIPQDLEKIGGITAGGSGTLSYHKVS